MAKHPQLATLPLAEYRRIETDLRRQIGHGRWPVGSMLPGRRDLAREYKVSLVTLDRAIGPLIADGLLRADDRRGTFVARLSEEDGGAPAAPTVRLARPPMSVPPPRPGLQPLTVGITATVAAEFSHEHLLLHELEQVFSHQCHSTLFQNRAAQMGQPSGLGEAVRAMIRKDVDALVVICLDIDRTLIAEELSRIEFGALPVVCILVGEINLALPHVFYDNRSGGYQAVQHLLERGWGEDITVVAPFTASWVSERIAGARGAVSYRTGGAGSVQVLAGEGREWDYREDPRDFGRRAAEVALASGWRPSGGIVCVNDGVALGVLSAVAGLGLEAGRDFAILGFDDQAGSRDIGLTSLRPPLQGMAREAARLLLDHAQGVDGSLQVRLRAHVIPRASTSARRA